MSWLQEWGERVDRLEPAIRGAGHRALKECATVIELLEDIKAAAENLYPGADTYEYPRLNFTGAEVKIVDGREGYLKIIKRIAITGGAAVQVDLYLLTPDRTGFVHRTELTAVGRKSELLDIPVPEGAPIYVESNAANTQVNLVIERVEV